jgi:hypothetical protein
MKKIIPILVFLSVISSVIFSQRLEVGLFAGGTTFNGDIDVTYQTFLPQIRFGAGGLLKYNFSENWVARAQFTSGTFGGDEKKYPTSDSRAVRGYSFTSKISDITAVIEWHPFGFTSQFRLTNSDMVFSFYGFTGLGETFFNPTINLNQQPDATNTNNTNNTSYSKNGLIIPIGGGIRWHLTDNFTLNGELSGRKVFSDYADGLKTNLNKTRFNDYYFFGGLTLTYLFNPIVNNSKSNNLYPNSSNSDVSCPKFK